MIPSAVGSLSHRFLLAELRDVGVVVDTESGDVLHINKSASTICRVLLDPSSSADAVGETARLLDIDRPTAEQHVRDVLSALSQPRTRATPRQGLQYSASGSGFYLCYDGLVVLRVEPE